MVTSWLQTFEQKTNKNSIRSIYMFRVTSHWLWPHGMKIQERDINIWFDEQVLNTRMGFRITAKFRNSHFRTHGLVQGKWPSNKIKNCWRWFHSHNHRLVPCWGRACGALRGFIASSGLAEPAMKLTTTKLLVDRSCWKCFFCRRSDQLALHVGSSLLNKEAMY